MKTTLDLPDELMRSIKVRAAQESRKLKDLVAELLRQGLSMNGLPKEAEGHRVTLPLVQCAHRASPDEEMTPERISRALLEDEARGAVAR